MMFGLDATLRGRYELLSAVDLLYADMVSKGHWQDPSYIQSDLLLIRFGLWRSDSLLMRKVVISISSMFRKQFYLRMVSLFAFKSVEILLFNNIIYRIHHPISTISI